MRKVIFAGSIGCIILISLILIGNITPQQLSNQPIPQPLNGANIDMDYTEQTVTTNDKTVTLIIDDTKFHVSLEDNVSAKAFAKMLPQTWTMNELNGNEKYVYLDTNLPTGPLYSGQILTGDIMLYGENCIVLFYKTFDTKYQYTKIGHIEGLKLTSDTNLTVQFIK